MPIPHTARRSSGPPLRGGVDAHAPMRAFVCKRASGGDRAVVGGMVFDGDRMRWVGNEAELEGFDADSCCGSDFECDGDSRARLKWLGWLAGWLCLPPLLSSALLRNQNAALHGSQRIGLLALFCSGEWSDSDDAVAGREGCLPTRGA
jgi:hypothetical protein